MLCSLVRGISIVEVGRTTSFHVLGLAAAPSRRAHRMTRPRVTISVASSGSACTWGSACRGTFRLLRCAARTAPLSRFPSRTNTEAAVCPLSRTWPALKPWLCDPHRIPRTEGGAPWLRWSPTRPSRPLLDGSRSVYVGIEPLARPKSRRSCPGAGYLGACPAAPSHCLVCAATSSVCAAIAEIRPPRPPYRVGPRAAGSVGWSTCLTASRGMRRRCCTITSRHRCGEGLVMG